MDTRSKPVRIATGLLLCVSGGAVCAALHVPLPWMIGSMGAMAIAQMLGADLLPVPGARDAAMGVIGTALGLYFTAPVVHEVASFWPWFVALGFAAIGFGALSGFVLSRLSGIDMATAYFGSMPGGASEMAMMGERHGARPDRVAFAHSVRMLLTVTVFPIAITLAGFSSTDEYRAVVVPFDAAGLVELFAITLAAGWVARRIGLPTAYMMGALLASILLTARGITFSSVPTGLTSAAQVMLGAALGVRFDRSFMRTAPRFVAALIPSVTVTLVAAALVGWGLAEGSGMYLGSGLLAAAPGGIAEMSITAKVLRIGVAFVTAAHIVRYLIVVLLTGPVFRFFGGGAARPDGSVTSDRVG